ncbi:MAG: hypothetical protein Q9192_004278 [Flavoplaca navasiana]
MAKDQLGQQQLAAASAAPADDLHDVSAYTNRLHKQASTHFPLSAEEPRTNFSTSEYPVESSDSPYSTQSHDPASASRNELIAKNRAQEAALCRLNGQDFQSRRRSKAPDAESVASTQPVLVKEYSQATPLSSSPSHSKMRSAKRSTGYRSSEMPPLESFSFQDILASIDSDVALSIDNIAEICGRSKMSMADEYSSHMPPQGDVSLARLQGGGNDVVVSRLDPVEEASSTHEEVVDGSQRSRIARLSLANPVVNQGDLLSTSVTATSVVAPNTQSSGVIEQGSDPGNHEFHANQLLAWMRSFRRNESRCNELSRGDSRAANALQKILESSTEMTLR